MPKMELSPNIQSVAEIISIVQKDSENEENWRVLRDILLEQGNIHGQILALENLIEDATDAGDSVLLEREEKLQPIVDKVQSSCPAVQVLKTRGGFIRSIVIDPFKDYRRLSETLKLPELQLLNSIEVLNHRNGFPEDIALILFQENPDTIKSIKELTISGVVLNHTMGNMLHELQFPELESLRIVMESFTPKGLCLLIGSDGFQKVHTFGIGFHLDETTQDPDDNINTGIFRRKIKDVHSSSLLSGLQSLHEHVLYDLNVFSISHELLHKRFDSDIKSVSFSGMRIPELPDALLEHAATLETLSIEFEMGYPDDLSVYLDDFCDVIVSFTNLQRFHMSGTFLEEDAKFLREQLASLECEVDLDIQTT